MDERAGLLESLEFLYEGLIRIEQIIDRKNALQADLNNYQMEIQNSNKRILTLGSNRIRTRKSASAGKAIGIIIVSVVALILYMIIAAFTALAAAVMEKPAASGTYIKEFIVIAVIAAGISVLISKGAGSMKRSSLMRADRAEIDARNRISYYQSEIQKISTELIPEADAQLIVVYQDYEAVIKAFPPDYCYSDAVERCMFYIKNQRAENLKEALNLYENDLYQQRVLDEQQKQTTAVQLSAKANMVSAAANVVTAFNTGQIANNTREMVGSLRNIENNTAQTASNTSAIARNTAASAQNTAAAAAASKQAANYAGRINRSVNGFFG